MEEKKNRRQSRKKGRKGEEKRGNRITSKGEEIEDKEEKKK